MREYVKILDNVDFDEANEIFTTYRNILCIKDFDLMMSLYLLQVSVGFQFRIIFRYSKENESYNMIDEINSELKDKKKENLIIKNSESDIARCESGYESLIEKFCIKRFGKKEESIELTRLDS